jgi:type I restriction enzyme S subunit
MPADWPTTRLGDLVTIKHGWAFRSEHFAAELTGKPIVVNIGNFRYEGGFRFESTTVKEYRGDYPSQYELSPNDILLAMTCQTSDGVILGIPGRIPDDGRCYLHNQRLGKVVVTNPRLVDKGFLYWLFLSPKFNHELFVTSTGTKILHTAPSRIENFRFPLPPLPEQKAIAHILGTLDDKIELNRRMNETLEGIARALFKSWFMDFDPVRAKAEGRQPVGLDAETTGLFPDSFQESELGLIPAGWRVSTIGDAFNLVMGQSPPGNTYNEEGFGLPFYQGRVDFGFRFPSRRVFCSAPTRRGKVNDTLVSVRAPVGDLNMASEECAIGRGVAAIRHASGARSFTYYFMQQFRDTLDLFNGEGTVFGSIGRRDFERLPVTAPPLSIINSFDLVASPFDDSIALIHRQNITLSELRDTLLPKLISGELRVPDAEKLLAESPV